MDCIEIEKMDSSWLFGKWYKHSPIIKCFPLNSTKFPQFKYEKVSTKSDLFLSAYSSPY